MHCVIIANKEESFPSSLLPIKGRAVIDYLIDDALIQKDISKIIIMSSEKSRKLLTKHTKNAFPGHAIEIAVSQLLAPVINGNEDIMILQGNIYSSLKLQDFIRYFKQFKTVTKAAFDKQEPKDIPFLIVPKQYSSLIDNLPPHLETHTYNCGSGYNINCI